MAAKSKSFRCLKYLEEIKCPMNIKDLVVLVNYEKNKLAALSKL